jgi:DNA repair protein RAD16
MYAFLDFLGWRVTNYISDSGLESMYRKELKGWNRDDGIVKEDSKCDYLS